jgi:uncharacterized coiled-coil protein SlyX
MADDDLRERLTDLEVRLAYQDRTVVTLDEVVRELAAKVAALEAELGRIRATAVAPRSPTALPPDEP